MTAKSLLFYLLFLLAFTFQACTSNQLQKAEKLNPFMFTVTSSELEDSSLSETVANGLLVEEQQLEQEIAYWNAAYPNYRWHQIMMEASQKHKGHKNGGRMAILHLAIYDALLVQGSHDKRSVVAAAAHRIISHYFPEQQQWLDSLLVQHQKVQLTVTNGNIKEVQLGRTVGTTVAEKYIKYSTSDNTDKVWGGQVPNNPKLWSGTPYRYGPTKKDWKPLTLTSAKQFRPGPAPEDWSADMQELWNFYKKNSSSDIAWKWKSQPVWDELLERKILEYGLGIEQSAYISAVFHAARFDATIAAWDGKYHYWGIRPFQYDPSFEPILQTPNFPGYPAGHTTVAGALSRVLSHFFPHDAEQFEALAQECSESRFEGGVHFRTDNEVGLEVGDKVGQHVVKVFEERTGW